MECWVPLFDIFLNSPCPETEAAMWLQKSFNPSSDTTPISTSSFISLLMKPTEANFSVSSTPNQEKRVMRIQTLPDLVQARILSFLAYDYQRFCNKDLCRIARIMLDEGKDLDFWVKKAAEKLLDLVSVSNYRWLSHLNLDSEEEHVEDEFQSLPDWLRDVAKDNEPLFSWLPISPDELSLKAPSSVSYGSEDESPIGMEKDKKEEDSDEVAEEYDVEGMAIDEQEDSDEVAEEYDVEGMAIDEPLDAKVENMAKSLKERLLYVDSTTKAVELAKEIRELCIRNEGSSLAVLNLIEPWNTDDETSTVLISHLSDGSEGDGLDWPSQILCSVILPKFLALREPSSRVLMAATIEYCKAHQRSAEYSLLFPLILRTEGVNYPICDVITRIFKESLHPSHVSSLCQKLLCKYEEASKLICLPYQRCLINEELVWTEYLFSLFHNILNLNIHLTQDSVDQLVLRVCEFAEKYSKSLKFGNFLLCFVNKCAPSLGRHKLLLTAAVENTNTLVTKSILSKLSGL